MREIRGGVVSLHHGVISLRWESLHSSLESSHSTESHFTPAWHYLTPAWSHFTPVLSHFTLPWSYFILLLLLQDLWKSRRFSENTTQLTRLASLVSTSLLSVINESVVCIWNHVRRSEGSCTHYTVSEFLKWHLSWIFKLLTYLHQVGTYHRRCWVKLMGLSLWRQCHLIASCPLIYLAI